jgi:conjugal transfer pilus assembly protein TraW
MKYYSRIIGYTITFLVIIISTIYLLFNNEAQAKDLGVYGEVWEIKEQNIVDYIKSQITEDKADKINKEFVSQTKKHINRPKSVDGITNTLEHKVHYYNPEITLTKDILDHQGTIMHRKGTKVNPLDHQTFTRQLLFINGDNKQQIKYAVATYRKVGYDLKIVLTKGSPIELMKVYNNSTKQNNLQIRFYFDQEGKLTQTFGIETVPTLVKKEGRLMKVEAIVVGVV